MAESEEGRKVGALARTVRRAPWPQPERTWRQGVIRQSRRRPKGRYGELTSTPSREGTRRRGPTPGEPLSHASPGSLPRPLLPEQHQVKGQRKQMRQALPGVRRGASR